jgi:hypothetical protein
VKQTALNLFLAMVLGGCATVTRQPATAPILPPKSPAFSESINLPQAKSPSICTAVQGQAQSYVQSALSADKEEAKSCLSKGSACWTRFAGLLDAQKAGLASMLGSASCPDAQAFVDLAQSYLQVSAQVARDCGMVGVPKCFATPSASAAKTRKAELESLLEGGDHG